MTRFVCSFNKTCFKYQNLFERKLTCNRVSIYFIVNCEGNTKKKKSEKYVYIYIYIYSCRLFARNLNKQLGRPRHRWQHVEIDLS